MTKEEVIIRCTEIFSSEGVKITTDELSHNLGISKRTLYTLFENKTNLIQECTIYILSLLNKTISDYHKDANSNVIEKLLPINSQKLNNLIYQRNRMLSDVKKLYPDIYKSIVDKYFQKIQNISVKLFEQGQEEGLFIKDINAQVFISLFNSSLHSFLNIKEIKFTSEDIYKSVFCVLLRGVCTEKGLTILQKNLTKKKERIIKEIEICIMKYNNGL